MTAADDVLSSSRKNLNKTKQSVVDRLNESLADAKITPDDVQNIFIREKEDRVRDDLLNKYKNIQSIKRLTL
jgi:hypothetical protein